MNDQTQLDQDAVNLAKAIRQTESGGNFQAKGKSGEYGAYQYTPATWEGDSKKYGVNVSLDQATPAQQNEVAYKKIKALKDAGHNVGEIASIWNSGNPTAYKDPSYTGTNKHGAKFDVPAYAKSVATAYQSIKGGGQPQMDPNNPSSISSTENASGASELPPTEQQQGGYKPWFKSSTTDSGLIAGFKAAGNVIPSAYNFGKNVVSAMNPINALKNIEQIPEAYRQAKEANQGSAAATIGNAIVSAPGEAATALVPQSIRQVVSGDIAGASKTMTEDPFGQVAPVVLAAEGGAKIADRLSTKNAMAEYVNNPYSQKAIPNPTTKYTDAFGKTVETIAKPVTAPAGAIGEYAGKLGASMASRLTGLDPSTIRQIISDPKEFSKIRQENASRGGLAGELKDVVDTRLEDLGDMGKGYQAIRGSNQQVPVPAGWIEQALADKGFTIKKGKIQASTNSVTRDISDVNAIQKFYNNWGKKTELTPNEFLNMRGDLGQLSKWDKVTGMGKTKAAETIGKDLYAKANKQIRDTRLQELQALDESYAPEVDFLKQIKKDYFDAEGNLKDSAPSRIANASNKVQLLSRLEQLMPGITKRIEILKAVEDIQTATGNKIGTYGRAIVGGAGFALGGLPGFIASEIIANPGAAVPILRSYGMLKAGAVTPIVNVLRVTAGDIQKSPIPLMSSLIQKQQTGV